MNTFDKVKVFLYALKLQFWEFINDLKDLCYTDKDVKAENEKIFYIF